MADCGCSIPPDLPPDFRIGPPRSPGRHRIELADTGDALKLDDTEDAVVGSLRSRASFSPPPRTPNGLDLKVRRGAPETDLDLHIR
jgi:hypothetical protein